MIHVTLAIEYKGIPFTIEIDAQRPSTFDLATLGVLLDRVKTFIDKMLEASKQ